MAVEDWRGLPDFFEATVTDAAGAVVQRRAQSFCPNGYEQQRIDPDGSDRSTFPQGCYGMPFTVGSRWGIDEGWASRVGGRFALKVPNGTYTVTMTIAERYRELWDIPAQDASSTVDYRVRNGTRETPHRVRATAPREAQPGPRPRVPVDTTPDPATLPDLRTLPAFGISTETRGRKDWLAFGADAWVGGSSLLDIEGFRRADEEVMDAFQYFYDGEQVVGRARVGEMDYDTRRGHHHWHLLQFASYRLLDATQQHVTSSKKQSFCIVPTDPVDLSLDNAERRPWSTGLESACGDRDALWIRETLPVGWGDTYYQNRGGQDFNITKVPNGTYFIEVAANPTGELFESDTTNNVSLREIELKGRRGARVVCVPGVGPFNIGDEGCGGRGFSGDGEGPFFRQ